MKTIVHTCSSILLRPNGITRYINAVIDLQKSQGHRVIFVSDAKPTQAMSTDEVYFANRESTYVPNFLDGHVWLQVDSSISATIKQVFTDNNIEFDLLISHDLHSFIACEALTDDGIFVQHESDVLNEGRYSYVSDEYLDLQVKLVHSTEWRIGLVVPSTKVSPKRSIYTPMPFDPVSIVSGSKSKNLLYIGDSSERKGAAEFMKVAKRLGVTPTVITHDTDTPIFNGADVFSFSLNQRSEMFALMSEHKVCYFSSKNECGPVAVLECLQFMPVVVNSSNPWTANIADWGVNAVPESEVDSTLKYYFNNEIPYDRTVFDSWAQNSKQAWIKINE